ncbi:uncharacterized protein [Amphiura filiformis]|uniref:uncharacterized protein n=1 Tax=Amphiura filiformis TaxID=82378 RepID=UPI003B228C48
MERFTRQKGRPQKERRKRKYKEEQQRILKEEQLQRERLQQQLEQEERRRQRQQEAKRVERQREELRHKKEEQERIRRQEEMIRAREERKQLEEQQQLERQRQERMRRDEMERQRLAEERELKRRQQQEAAERQRQRELEERKKQQRQRESFREENIRHKSRNLPKSDIGKLTIPEGYNLEDITVEIVGNQAFVKGHHVCGCDEKCYDREFERRIPLPTNVDTRTINASLYPGGTLTLQGVKYKQVIQPVDTQVTVEGVGLSQRTASSDDSCKKLNNLKLKPSGFKLKKMNARTGEVFDDIQVLEDSYPKFESEIDDDGLTIEVVD